MSNDQRISVSLTLMGGGEVPSIVALNIAQLVAEGLDYELMGVNWQAWEMDEGESGEVDVAADGPRLTPATGDPGEYERFVGRA